ncbi:MAG TPA: RNA polymerase sigma factor SigM [Frankiaceae bacterium]|nr:RNA polymerase sigma factor SigM [Frankiaceae bacterium]
MPPAEPADVDSARPLVADDDRALLRRHVDGDPYAFDLLVRRHRDQAWAIALRTLHDPDEAADAVQEAFVSAYRAAGSFRGDAQVSTWLHRIVVNACLDRLRRRRARPTVPLDEDLPLAAPGDAIAERETRLVVQEALSRLPAEQRLAIILVDLEGRPVEEAGRILGVPAGTVKSRCCRGRARLAALLGHLRAGNPAVSGSVPLPGSRGARRRPVPRAPTLEGGTLEGGAPG